MRKGYRPWTDEELKLAIDLKQDKWTDSQIAQELGRTASAVSVKRSLQRYAQDRHRSQEREHQSQRYEHVTSVRISDQQLAERESRQVAAYQRDTTALLMGDPPPGYSARDRRGM